MTLPEAGRFRLKNLRTPACYLGQPGTGFAPLSLTVADGRLADGPADATLDMKGAIVLPCGVDMHTHLDKGHIWPRAANPDGSFMGALTTVAGDRAANWSADDVRRRMEFSLKCAFAHGTRAVRTHLDSIAPQDDISWPLFDEVRADWRGRIELQAAALVAADNVTEDGAYAHTADLVKRFDGVLGAVTYPIPDIARRVETVLKLASARGLPVDFHVDETLDPTSATLRVIAETVLKTGFDAPVVVGHCCSLSTQDPAEADHTLDLVAEAGIAVVSLPMCNLYLQDRQPGRTPRYRGITLVHEMAARGIPVSFASDNTRDPFYAYGDMDLVEVLREATRIGHLDHSRGDWAFSVNRTPADVCGFAPCGKLGEPADFILFNARSWTEFFARPQSDRVVVRGGRAIDRTLPAHAELDDLMEGK
ncbi:cytosine deaminase [Halovulum dunhuangense]|uniref:cytosine deaminase n=1 Tax=Halovulum dunhuangense TaxID=1505036 RepID=UPI0031B6064E